MADEQAKPVLEQKLRGLRHVLQLPCRYIDDLLVVGPEHGGARNWPGVLCCNTFLRLLMLTITG